MLARTLLLAALVVALPVLTTAALPTPEDDAGSGRDAGDGPEDAVPIESGRVYEGFGAGIALDRGDWFAFQVQAGDQVEARLAGAYSCARVHDVAGAEVVGTCSVAFTQLRPMTVTASASGTWYLQVESAPPDPYKFSVGVDEPAPEVGLIQLPVSEAARLPVPSPADQTGPHVVVAVIDTGINPYHEFFRASALQEHPATWLDGYPADATPLALSLDEDSYEDALARDEALWASVERSPESDVHLYTFPGTRVVGAVSFHGRSPHQPILDDHGHGTMTAGMALGADMTQADGNVLLVMVDVAPAGPEFERGLRWVAAQPWIDIVSLSAGLPSPLPDLAGVTAPAPGWVAATRALTQSGKPLLQASGNGLANDALSPTRCQTYTHTATGPHWVTRIGAAEPETENPSWWHCVPVDAIAVTDVVSAHAQSTTATAFAGGTSAAAPNAMARVAHLLSWARDAGIDATPREALDHVLNASRWAEPGVEPWAQPGDPASAPLVQGYGVVNDAALDRAKVSLAAGAPEARSDVDAWFRTDRQVREGLWASGGLFNDPSASR